MSENFNRTGLMMSRRDRKKTPPDGKKPKEEIVRAVAKRVRTAPSVALQPTPLRVIRE